ncbi:MAG: anhydro-N-acetylmuramic acid kinase [Candidatus Riflebacteria bacterium]|nr:anhydro-N-acetylmuramic acid kinase [Candidatus Riflebacteria bacterium]
MGNKKVKVLGMMSGTSGDAIDGAMMSFDSDGIAELVWFDSCSFKPAEFARIQKLMRNADARDITLGASYIAELYACACHQFFATGHGKPDYIAAHGQTIYHQPQPTDWDGIALTGTLQLLNGSLLAQRTGLPVICNFRSADMAVGGEGAPLVPFADLHLFGKQAKRDLLLLNIGGMANISAIKAGRIPEMVCAFDTGPGNVLMDAAMQRLGLGNYDRDGCLAASGCSNREVVLRFLTDPYFAAPPPKSTGREYFNCERLDQIEACLQKPMLPADLLSTLLDITVESIAMAVRALVERVNFPADLAVSGGGALNVELMSRLAKLLDGLVEVKTSEAFAVPVMAKEAMAFAVLGDAFVRRCPANLPAATGASRSVILGQLHPV